MNEPSLLYKAMLQALGVTQDSVVAHAWGRDYTLADLEAQTSWQRRLTNWKLRSYNWLLRIDLLSVKVRVWFWRTINEMIP